MMSQHLDIKLFTEILKEIKEVSFKNQRSVSTNIDIFGASDTDHEDDFIPGDRAELKPPPITPLSRSPRGSSRANSFKKVQLSWNSGDKFHTLFSSCRSPRRPTWWGSLASTPSSSRR